MFSLSEIARILQLACKNNMQPTGYKVDSRKVVSGDLFFAIRGAHLDPHRLLKEVVSKGALAAVVEKSYSGQSYGLELLRVDNVLLALQNIAKAWIGKISPTIVGITGSCGKTTTKDFAACLLSGKYRVGKTHVNQNSQIGLPLSILELSGNEEVVVLEMGMTEPGEIARLCEIAPPDIGVITNVCLWHVEHFSDSQKTGSPEITKSKIAKAKAEIFSSEKTKIGIVDHEILSMQEMPSMALQSFSIHNPKADYFLSSIENFFYVDEKAVRIMQFDLPFYEEHFLHDFLAALAIARNLKMHTEELIPQFSRLSLPKMRFEKVHIRDILFINDAYNASPDSVKMALKYLPKPEGGGKRIAVLGEMSELGEFTKQQHEEVGRFALQTIDHLLCLGKKCEPMVEIFEAAKKPAELFVSHHHLAKRLQKLMAPKDVVLLKASRSMELEKILTMI